MSTAKIDARSVAQRIACGVDAVEQRFHRIERAREARRAIECFALPDEFIALWTQNAPVRHCETVAEMVACELCRRGLHRVRVGSRTYCCVEARVLTDVVRFELDLDEIAASIEEARWEQACL